MKNLKRALSLVLSTAMLLGMMVVGTGAAFDDVKAEHNEEAIAVVTAMGIMEGTDNGFNPDGKVTRAQMAVIMSHVKALKTGGAIVSEFTDVPTWAADFVDACYADGIMAGIGGGLFGSDVEVTTAQAALMMLKALGYYSEAAVPADWDTAAVKKASEIDLLDGISAKSNQALTRNDIAQLVLNTMQAQVVTESVEKSGTSIKVGDVEISIDGADATYTYGKQLMKEIFGNEFRCNDNGKTVLGLPAVKWTQKVAGEDAKAIITVAMSVDEELIAEEAITTNAALVELVEDEINEDFEGSVTLMNADAIAAGDVLYFYEYEEIKLDEESEEYEVTSYKVYTVTYKLVQVEEIKDATKAEIKADKNRTEKYVLADKAGTFFNTEWADFDYEEGDYVLIAVVDGKVGASELAEIVEGKVTAKKGTTYTIGGEKIESLIALTVGAEYEVALNKAGQIIEKVSTKEETKSADYAYIYAVVVDKAEAGKVNEDGLPVSGEDVYTAYVVLADGTKTKYELATEDEDEKAFTAEYLKGLEGEVVAYEFNDDDQLLVAEKESYATKSVVTALDEAHKTITVDGKKMYANNATEFVFAKADDDNKMVVTTATGIKNVELNAETEKVAVYDAEEQEILVVFVMAKDKGVTTVSDKEFFVLLDNVATVSVNDDDENEYTYEVYVDGEETELTFDTEAFDKDTAKYGVYTYELKNDVVDTYAPVAMDALVEYELDGEFEIGGKFYAVADDAEIVVITYTTEDGETEVTYDFGDLAEEMVIYFELNDDGEIAVAFAKETINNDEE